jgi:histone H2A
MTPTSKKGRLSQSSRAGIIFPVPRMHRYLKSAPLATTRVTKGASVYLAAVTEYLVGRYIKYFIIT